jgi:hypothetical protein
MIEIINKLVRVSRRLLQELGREPSDDEIGKEMGITREKVREIIKVIDIHLPKVEKKRVVPLTVQQVAALMEAVPEHYRPLVHFFAGTGARPRPQSSSAPITPIGYLDPSPAGLPGTPRANRRWPPG